MRWCGGNAGLVRAILLVHASWSTPGYAGCDLHAHCQGNANDITCVSQDCKTEKPPGKISKGHQGISPREPG